MPSLFIARKLMAYNHFTHNYLAMKVPVTQLTVRIFLLSIALTLFVSRVFAQNYPVTSINISMPANPDANTTNWGAGTSLLTISATARTVNGRVDGLAQESKILVTIKKGGAIVGGTYTGSTAPQAGFNTISKVWAGSNALALLGKDYVLPAGDYELTVQFFQSRGAVLSPASELKTKPFTIRGNEQQTYQAPQPLAPANNNIFKEADITKPISFRWTPVVPRPQEPTTYRLKVWQLMQGQTGTQAMRTNQPIFTKDVDNITQAVVNNLVTGPCKPPYLCSFVWNVQALNREGKPIGSNNGTSETFAFKVDEGAVVTAGTLKLKSPANGVQIATNEAPQFSWFPLTTATGQETYKIKIIEIKGDESPEAAFRTNKPIFEKDSGNWLQVLPRVKFTAGKRYAWNVQALNREGKPVGTNNGTSELFTFKVGTTVAAATIKLSLPANGAIIQAGEAPKFTWLPPSPVISGQSYKIKIVEIKGDESPEQAFRTNKPIFEKDSIQPLSFTYPPKGPVLKVGQKYAWGVQTSAGRGNPTGEVKSDVFSFSVASGGCVAKLSLKSIACGDYTPAGFKYSVCVTYTSDAGNTCNIAYNDAQNAALNSLTGHNLANIIKDGFGGAVSNITFASSPSNSLAPGQSVDVCFTLTSSLPYAKIATYGLCKDGKELIAPNFANDVLDLDLKACVCTYCDEIEKWNFKEEKVTTSSEAPFIVNLSTSISAPAIAITNFKAELVSFTQDGKQQECFGCNINGQTFGNFVGGTFGAWGNGVFPLYGNNTTHHTLSWFSATGATTTMAGSAISISFTAPPLNPLNCCDDEISFCIRYSFTDKECRTCSFVKCYTVIRKHK